MTFRILPLVVALFFFTYASASEYTSIKYNLTLTSDYPTNRVFIYPVGPQNSLPSGIRGPLTLNITTPLDVEICIQEFVEVSGNFSQNCNLGGYFNVSVNGTSSVSKFIDALDSLESEAALGFREDFYEVTRKISFEYFGSLASQQNMVSQAFNTTFRLDTLYYISARFLQASPNTSSIYVTLEYQPDLCLDGQIGLPNGQCADYTAVEDGVASTQKFTQSGTLNSIQYYTYGVTTTDANTLTAGFTATVLSSAGFLSNNAYALGSSQPAVNLLVYARRDAVPDLVDMIFDAAFNLTINGTTAEAVLQSPFIGSWYYTVINQSPYSLKLTTYIEIQVCKNALVGPFCNETAIDLTNQPITNSTFMIGNGGLQYFTVNNLDLIVGTGTEKLVGLAPALFASFWSWPANDSYIVASKGNPVNLITASIPLETLKYYNSSYFKNVTWRIAAWTNEGQQYHIWANQPCCNNCTYKNDSAPEGVCNIDTGECACNSGYTGLWCEKSGLAVVWIILIVIAVAIVLAIATGVPIACYLKSKKRKQYERV